MKVVFSEAARYDLLRIGDYIAEDNPLRALTFIDELEDRCLQLEHHPLSYPILARRPLSNIRRLSCMGTTTSSIRSVPKW